MPATPRAVILDLDAAIIDSRPAWKYALEEAVMMVAGERADVEGLCDEYRHRPWHHVVPVLIAERNEQERCIQLCEQFYRRSALKRLLVFDGIGMALDKLRGAHLEMGGVTRETHPNAMRQIESTGVDRFLTVLSPTNEGPWNVRERFEECIRYLEKDPAETAFVSPVQEDLAKVAECGAIPVFAGWSNNGDEGLAHPSLLRDAVRGR